jgi:hypothetical protein
MKLSAFKSMLRELIREEVQYAVKKELKVLTEQKTAPKQSQQKTKPSYVAQRTTPLVTLDEPFSMSGANPISALLQETANNMAGFDQETDQANPDFPMGSAGTDMFIKDYSEVLKKSQGIR